MDSKTPFQALRFFHKFNDGKQNLKPLNGMYFNGMNFATSCNGFLDGTIVQGFGFNIKSPGTYHLVMNATVSGPKNAMFVIGLGERKIQNIQIRCFGSVGEIDQPLNLICDEVFALGKPCEIWIAIFADWYEMKLHNEQLFAYRGIVGTLSRIDDYQPKLDIALIDTDARAKDDQTTSKGN